MKKTFKISGMGCAKCVAKVKASVGSVVGVEKVEVSLENKSMLCEYDESKTDASEIIKAVQKVGFDAEE